MKQCTKCGSTGPFPRKTGTKDGLNCRCMACVSAYRKEYRLANQEHFLERDRKYHREHRERRNAQSSTSYYKHREKYRAQAREYYQQNKEWLRVERREYDRTHADAIRQQSRNRYQKNKEPFKASHRRWCQKNRDKLLERNRKRRALLRGVRGTYSQAEWNALKEHYQFRCLHCGKSEPEIVLEPDHVVPLSKQGANTIDNIQPLCEFCNNQKHDKTIDYRPVGSVHALASAELATTAKD